MINIEIYNELQTIKEHLNSALYNNVVIGMNNDEKMILKDCYKKCGYNSVVNINCSNCLIRACIILGNEMVKFEKSLSLNLDKDNVSEKKVNKNKVNKNEKKCKRNK